MVSGLFTLHTIRDPDSRKDIGSIRSGDPRTPTRILDINPANGPAGHIHLYPGTSAPRLAAFLGAFAHGGQPEHITIRCMLKPQFEFVHLSVGAGPAGDAWVYANIREERGSARWLAREPASRLFMWLSEWLKIETDPIYRKPIGAYSSEEEYQEYERPRYHVLDPEIDDVE